MQQKSPYQPVGVQQTLDQQQQQYQYYQRICAHQTIIQRQQNFSHDKPLCPQQTVNQQQFDERPKINQSRVKYFRKVYGFISYQLLLTILLSLLFIAPREYFSAPVKKLMGILLYVSGALILIFSLACLCLSRVRTAPANYFVLGVFTLAESYLAGFLTTFTPIAFLITVLTLSMTLTFTLHAWTTRKEINAAGAPLWIAGWSLLAFSVLFFFRKNGIFDYEIGFIFLSIFFIIMYYSVLTDFIQKPMGENSYQLGLGNYIGLSWSQLIWILTNLIASDKKR